MRFNYQQYPCASSPSIVGGTLFRPEAYLRITGPGGMLSAWAVIDMGSDDTVFPLSVARRLGVPLDANQSWTIEGIGGQSLTVFLGIITLELMGTHETFRWHAKVGFIDFADPQGEVFLLGHLGCLEYCRLTCDGNLHELDIEVTPAFPGQVL